MPGSRDAVKKRMKRSCKEGRRERKGVGGAHCREVDDGWGAIGVQQIQTEAECMRTAKCTNKDSTEEVLPLIQWIS